MQAVRQTVLLRFLTSLALAMAVGCGVSDPLLGVDPPAPDAGTDAGDADAGTDLDGGEPTDGGDADGGTDAGTPSPVGTFTIELTSPSPVDFKALFQVTDCGKAESLLINTGDIPEPTDETWMECLVEEGQTYSYELPAGGLFELRVWVRTADGEIFDAPPRFSVVRGSMFVMGDAHSCALLAGRVKCWGDNTYGQLGTGDNVASPIPVTVPGLESEVTAIAGGSHGHHTCALQNGRVLCWGRNSMGQVGNPSAIDLCGDPAETECSLSPVVVVDEEGAELTNAISIFAGFSHTCAQLDDLSISCWGDNSFGQLMRGTNDGPQPAAGKATAVPEKTLRLAALGVVMTCVRTETSIVCSGLDYLNNPPAVYGPETGLLGRGESGPCQFGYLCSGTPVTPRVLVDAPAEVEQIAVGYYHACATIAGAVRCWGTNHLGQYGDSSVVPSQNGSLVTLGEEADLIVSGAHHTCARLDGGRVACWGLNDFGQLGAITAAACTDGLACSRTPVPVSDLDSVVALAAGRYQTCAAAHGKVWCWGGNAAGELGAPATNVCPDPNGRPRQCSLTPLEVQGLNVP